MRKFLTGFLIVAILLIAGDARADRTIWFHNYTGNVNGQVPICCDTSWYTTWNITNTAASSVTATITFYGGTAGIVPTVMGSTSRTMGPGALWNFSSLDSVASTITSTQFQSNVRGTAKIVSSDGSSIKGGSLIFNNQVNAGFSLNLPFTE